MELLALSLDEAARKRHTATLSRPALSPAKLLAALSAEPFAGAADMLQVMLARALSEGLSEQTLQMLDETASLLSRADSSVASLRALDDLHTLVLSSQAALLLENGETALASSAAATALTALTREPRRKDEPFLLTLGGLLYTIARIHVGAHSFKQARREVEKAMRVFERLARHNPARYTAALLTLQQAAAEVAGSCMNQMAMIERCRAMADECQQHLADGSCSGPEALAATRSLCEALHTQGLALAHMGHPRQAVHYFTRALRYLTRLPRTAYDEAAADLQAEMSVDLADALMQASSTRSKGVHLLNTLLQKLASSASPKSPELTARIRALLDENAARRLAILDVWQKIIPK